MAAIRDYDEGTSRTIKGEHPLFLLRIVLLFNQFRQSVSYHEFPGKALQLSIGPFKSLFAAERLPVTSHQIVKKKNCENQTDECKQYLHFFAHSSHQHVGLPSLFCLGYGFSSEKKKREKTPAGKAQIFTTVTIAEGLWYVKGIPGDEGVVPIGAFQIPQPTPTRHSKVLNLWLLVYGAEDQEPVPSIRVINGDKQNSIRGCLRVLE